MILQFPPLCPTLEALVSAHCLANALNALNELEPDNECREDYIAMLEAHKILLEYIIARKKMSKNLEALVKVGKL